MTALKGTVLLFGVGNRLRGDDGVGPAVVEALKARGLLWLQAVDCGVSPENWLAVAAAAKPREVIVVDAALMGLPPGTVRRLSVADLDDSPSLGRLPTVWLLSSCVEAKKTVIAIEPERCHLSLALSETVAGAVETVVQAMTTGTWDKIPLLAHQVKRSPR